MAQPCNRELRESTWRLKLDPDGQSAYDAEFARRGQAIYAREVAPKLSGANSGKIIAIDIDSGEFALDTDTLRAAQALRARIPDAQIWCVRIGYPAVDRIG